jgi:phosphoribosylformimino-5-aminoimidazole carboxamide ribotide isomerase
MLNGVNHTLYSSLVMRYPDLKVIASGGVHHLDDLHQLKKDACHGAIVGKAIYEHRIQIKDLLQFQSKMVVP